MLLITKLCLTNTMPCGRRRHYSQFVFQTKGQLVVGLGANTNILRCIARSNARLVTMNGICRSRIDRERAIIFAVESVAEETNRVRPWRIPVTANRIAVYVTDSGGRETEHSISYLKTVHGDNVGRSGAGNDVVGDGDKRGIAVNIETLFLIIGDRIAVDYSR